MIQLQSLLLLLAAAVLIVVLCRRIKMPAMLGYLLVGMTIGPHALGLIGSSKEASHLAEFGVVFLMFTLGLEFNLARLRAMRRVVFGLGSTQVIVMLALVIPVVMLLGGDWKMGLALGGALAMSSTAMASKMLTDRNEIRSPHGQNAIGILLFQDLAVVPYLIIIPVLVNADTALLPALGKAAIKIVFVLLILLYLGQRLMRPLFGLVAKQNSSELFMLNLLLVALGTAWLTDQAGLSLPLGAFLAGMLVAETDFRYQVEEDIRPFRDLLLGLFFVTVGMTLDFSVLLQLWWLALLVLLALVPGKIALITLLSRLFGSSAGTSWRTGIALGQGGEFAFVMLALCAEKGLVQQPVIQATIAAIVISMLITPVLVHYSDSIVLRLASSEWMNMAANLHQIAVRSMQAQGHVILCGYGRTGQSLGRLFTQEHIPFFALDLDPEKVREAGAAGDSVVFGEAARREVLIAAGLVRAKAMIITFTDTRSALKILEVVRQMRPDMPVIVRTRDDSEIDRLKEAGATEVVAEVLEGSLMLASHTLMLLGTPLNRVLRYIRSVREQRYSLFRGFFRGLNEDLEDSDRPQPRLHTVLLPTGSAALGLAIGELSLAEFHVELRSVRRQMRQMPPVDTLILEAGDVLVLCGETENLAATEIMLLQGR